MPSKFWNIQSIYTIGFSPGTGRLESMRKPQSAQRLESSHFDGKVLRCQNLTLILEM